ncbi:hypothetical protein Nmel_014565 [Mimus melanotis]
MDSVRSVEVLWARVAERYKYYQDRSKIFFFELSSISLQLILTACL